MTHEQFYGLLFERATGWLGYTPREALESHAAHLQAAIAGRMELLKTIFGEGQGESQLPKGRPMTASRFRAMSARHNQSFSKGAKNGGLGNPR